MNGGRIRLATVLVGAVFAAAGFATASFTQPGGTERGSAETGSAPPPSELWGSFPLGEPTVATALSSSPRTSAAPSPAAGAEDSDGSVRLTLLAGLAALAVLALALSALFFLKQRQRRLVLDSREGLLAIMSKPGPSRRKIAQAQAFAAGLGCDMVSAHRPRARGKQVTDESRGKSAEQAPAAGGRGYAELGDRVAAVLQAAEEAAEQMRSDAERSVEQTTRRAEQESKSLLESAKSEAQRVRLEADAEAKNTREAVESYATNHRREAEEKATKLLSEAETQARASREAAEAMAQRIEESARTLEEEVREQERMIRGRMQRYLAALRDVSGQIEEVLGETDRGEPALVEALDVERAKQNQSSSQGQNQSQTQTQS